LTTTAPTIALGTGVWGDLGITWPNAEPLPGIAWIAMREAECGLKYLLEVIRRTLFVAQLLSSLQHSKESGLDQAIQSGRCREDSVFFGTIRLKYGEAEEGKDGREGGLGRLRGKSWRV
jgi:hypothetical protein